MRTKTSSEINRTSKAAGRLTPRRCVGGFASVRTQCREPSAVLSVNDDPHNVAVTAERLEAKRVYLGAPEAEGRCDMQTEEMPTVRPKCSPRPAARFEHFDNLKVAGKPVAVDGIEQQDIAVAPQAGTAVKMAFGYALPRSNNVGCDCSLGSYSPEATTPHTVAASPMWLAAFHRREYRAIVVAEGTLQMRLRNDCRGPRSVLNDLLNVV